MAEQHSPGGGPRVPPTVAVVVAMAAMLSVATVASVLSTGDRTSLEIQTQTSAVTESRAVPEPETAVGQASTTTSTTTTTTTAPLRLPPSRVTPPGQVGPRTYTASEMGQTFGDSIFRVETTGCGISGSGTAWAIRDRLLVTNGHVVHTDMTPLITDRDGERFRGRVIAWFEDPDIAVISVNRTLAPLRGWADTGRLVEGDPLVVIGYPQPGLDFSVVQAGIVSFRTGEDGATELRPAIRSDIDIDPGASGAPVFTGTAAIAGVVTEAEVDADGRVRSTVIYTRDTLSALLDEVIDLNESGETDIAGLIDTASSSAGCDAFAADDSDDEQSATLSVGDCYARSESPDPTVTPCDEPHDAELFSAFDRVDAADADFPGADTLTADALEVCRTAFESYVGLEFAFSQFDIETFTPTASSWAEGDRTVRCGLHRIDLEPIIGSARDSAS